jgi:uncharacterized membrane protein
LVLYSSSCSVSNIPTFHGEIIAELERLHASGTVRVIDSMAVHKDADGELEVEHLSNLTEDEAIELGSKIGALIGLGIDGEEGMEAGAVPGAQQAAAGGVQVLNEQEGWDVLEDIPNDTAAALILLEHHWAVPLRDAIVRAGASGSATASSARWTSWRSGCSRPKKRRNCATWKRPAAANMP